MRKIWFLLLALILPRIASAQGIGNVDMEYWRQSASGDSSPVYLDVPMSWYGSDSVVIALGQDFGYLALGASVSDWHRQIFKESTPTFVHSGMYAAKIVSVYQDTFLTPGIISNAVPGVSIIYTPPGISSFQYQGGSPVSVKPVSISAWVKYFPGKDISGFPGIDSGLIFIQARSYFAGKDSTIGTASVPILPSTQWDYVTANIVYIDTIHPVDTLLLAFVSTTGNSMMDSSTLYVDDISMASVPNPVYIDHTLVRGVSGSNQIVVYPNPSSGLIRIDGGKEMTIELFCVSGQSMISKQLDAQDMLDVTSLPDGLYFYSVTGRNGAAIQRGKIVLSR